MDRILVPTDMSDFARPALAWAGLFRHAFNAKVTVMFANEPYYPFGLVEPYGYAAVAIDAAEVHERLERTLREYVNDDAIETMVVDEPPARAIVRVADELNADLIVMGTHGRSGWQRALLGSVAEKVLHDSTRPTLTITSAAAHAPQQPDVRTVICSPRSRPQAFAIAEGFDAGIVVAAGNAERLLETAERLRADLIVIDSPDRIVRVASVPVLTTHQEAQHEKVLDSSSRRGDARGGSIGPHGHGSEHRVARDAR